MALLIGSRWDLKLVAAPAYQTTPAQGQGPAVPRPSTHPRGPTGTPWPHLGIPEGLGKGRCNGQGLSNSSMGSCKSQPTGSLHRGPAGHSGPPASVYRGPLGDAPPPASPHRDPTGHSTPESLHGGPKEHSPSASPRRDHTGHGCPLESLHGGSARHSPRSSLRGSPTGHHHP